MRRDPAWLRWAIGSARDWRDIAALVPETGIDLVDTDHRCLLQFVVDLNLLAEDCRAGLAPELLVRQRALLEGLLEYTRSHFSREEALILRFGAPNLERQRAEHGEIVAALDGMVADFAAGRLTVSPELRRAVFNWMATHIAGSDYETFLLANLEGAFARARSWEDIRLILRSTGVDAMDREHRDLVEAILAATEALGRAAGGQGETSLSVRSRFEQLDSVCRKHFSDEEAFMLDFGIPGVEAQREAHGKFLSRVEGFLEAAAHGPGSPEDARELSRELISWIVEHVNKLDYEAFRKGDWRTRAFETRPAAELAKLIRLTGYELVDAQHLEFTRCVEAFGAELRRPGSDVSVLARSFDDLIEFAARHFAYEETVFPPDAKLIGMRHKAEHAALLSTLRAYRERLAQRRLGAADAVKGVVLGWWVHHTNTVDVETLGSAVMGGGAHAG